MSTYMIFGATSDIGMSYIEHLNKQNPDTRILAFGNNSIERIENIKCDKIIPIKCDLNNISEVDKKVSELIGKYTDITHFINFAYGKLRYERVTAFSAEETEKNFRIQITSCCTALNKLIPIMKKNKYGRIIIITSSVATGMPPTFMSEYAIVKYAAVGMIKSYARECAKYGITVNGIAPSIVETRLWDTLPSLLKEMNIKEHPQKRSVSYKEINACIDFLISPDSDFITGENIVISGGETF